MKEQFGQFIKKMRKRKMMTQKELAKLLNISDKAVSKWEVGDSYPDITLLTKIASIFEITVDDLLFCESSPKERKSEITKKLILFNIASNIILVVVLLIFLVMTLFPTKSEGSFFFAITDIKEFTSVMLLSIISITVIFGIYNLLMYIRYGRGIEDEKNSNK